MTDSPRALSFHSGLAVQKALEAGILDSFTATTGIPLDIDFDPTSELVRRIHEGARPDVLIAVTKALGPLTDAGIFDADSIVHIGRVGIGVAVAAGAALPDISTPESFVDALRSARSVAFSQAGASGIYFRELLARLGILEEVEGKATVLDKGFTANALIDGRADLAIQQLSELAYVPGVQIVGPLPPELQNHTEFSLVQRRTSPRDEAAAQLADWLTGPSARGAYRESGVEV